MKKFLLSTLILCALFSAHYAEASKIRAYLSYASFYSPEHGTYFETYMSFWGKSIAYVKNPDGTFQGKLEITMLFKQNDTIRNFKKYEFLTPALTDTLNLNVNYLDQQRFTLPDGNYNFEISILDANRDKTPLKIIQPITIYFDKGKVNLSGIELIESYKKSENQNILSKSGYDFIPYLNNFYPEKANKLTFYSEIYNADKVFGPEEKYLVKWNLESFENGKVLNDYVHIKKETAKPVNVILGEFDISRLPSGNYNLAIEVRDKENNLIISNRMFLQRSNPNIHFEMKDITSIIISNTFVASITSRDTIAEYIRSLAPISSEIEKAFVQEQLKTASLETMQQYFYNFWKNRNSLEPDKEWEKYNLEVIKVNNDFKTPIRKGYDTDRGRVYLQYGPPNTIVDRSYESEDVPYQIWHYYKLGNNQSNRKFVFYNPNLANNEYQLAHSDALGEVSNPNWQYLLKRQINVDDSESLKSNNKYIYGNSGTNYNDPY